MTKSKNILGYIKDQTENPPQEATADAGGESAESGTGGGSGIPLNT